MAASTDFFPGASSDVSLALLASTDNGEGASLIGIEDSGGLITATEVEGALAEHATAIAARTVAATLAATTLGAGAALVGVHDAATQITATNVEGALAELATAIGDIVEGEVIRYTVTVPGGDGAGNVGDLFSNPVTLVAAAGATTVLVPAFCAIFYDYGTAAYDATSNPMRIILRYSGGTIIAQTPDNITRNHLSATADWVEVLFPGANVTEPADRAVFNEGLQLYVSSQDPYSAAGDSPLKVILGYRVVTFS